MLLQLLLQGGSDYQLSITYVTGNSLVYPNPHFNNNQPVVITFSATGDAGSVAGAQNLQQVLNTGNDAGGQAMFNVPAVHRPRQE